MLMCCFGPGPKTLATASSEVCPFRSFGAFSNSPRAGCLHYGMYSRRVWVDILRPPSAAHVQWVESSYHAGTVPS